MPSLADFDEILALVSELERASEVYYQTPEQSPLTDAEYDAKEEYLRDLVDRLGGSQTAQSSENEDVIALLDRANQLLGTVAAGTETLSRQDGAVGKVRHNPPMLSLAKAKTLAEVQEFLEKTKRVGAEEKGWVLQAKLDGLALSVKYSAGKLVQLATRGNGEEGEDISAKIALITGGVWSVVGLPLELDGKLSGTDVEMRGEIFMTDEQFEALNEHIISHENAKVLKHSRNATSGQLLGDTDRPAAMTFLVYTCFSAEGEIIDLEVAERTGLRTVAEETAVQLGRSPVAKTDAEVFDTIKEFGRLREENRLTIPTDGIVVKCVDDAVISKRMGNTAHHPSSQIAFKYPSIGADTQILHIEIGVGRTGRISYRAKIEPIVLDGITIQYATLHNFSWMKEREIRAEIKPHGVANWQPSALGSKVHVVRANDVIPYVEAVLSNPDDAPEVVEPELCPLCKAPLNKDTLLFRCPNDECESRGVEALKTALSKKYLNVENISSKTLDALVDQGFVADLADIFTLTEEELASVVVGKKSVETQKYLDLTEEEQAEVDLNEYFGPLRAKKVIESIEKAKNVTLPKLLASLNIRLLGLEVAKALAKHFGSLPAILSASVEELEEVELISNVKAHTFVEGFERKMPLINRLGDAGVKVAQFAGDRQQGFVAIDFETGSADPNFASDSNTPNAADCPLKNETIVLSGSFGSLSRDEAREWLEFQGAKTSSSVSSKTTIVIADPESSSSKVLKAKALGISIITPDDFLKKFNLSAIL
ncbi:MAG: NAD-dependent DNA ligase LigA [Candidatus Ancillula sp.]|jgi:DNA ligase (NAD+)|nr:NAD-dependent DNA ligase LigA [Candidatus Ancillula sp.]